MTRTFGSHMLTLGTLLLLAGCASSSGTATVTAGQATVDPTVQAGCSSSHEVSTEEMYVAHLINCDGNSLYVFNDSTARDNYRKVAEQFGAVVLREGETWLIVKGAPPE